jgi:hypothetical protein
MQKAWARSVQHCHSCRVDRNDCGTGKMPVPPFEAATIEIDLAGKYRVRVGGGVDAQALRRVLDVLERR